MKFKLVVDSCCELTAELKEKLFAKTVPLTMQIGDEVFVDDENLDVALFLTKMKQYKGHVLSSCPSPGDYADAYKGADTTFAITLSSKLSNSYNSAMVGKEMQDETDVHVFDSKSASAGELLIALKIKELIEAGLHKTEILKKIDDFINGMKTFFVLENLDNLIKNGRMTAIAARIASLLGIRPILGSDGNGNIAFYAKARGKDQAVEKLAETIGKHCEDTRDKTLVITHCNNSKVVEQLKQIVQKNYFFKNIFVQPTGGLSSMYANQGGVIIAF